jgi:uncharacterized membrane protein YkvA (DUF1232 family)
MSGPILNVVRHEAGLWMSWQQQAQRVRREAQVFYFAFKHPSVRWSAKIVAVCTAGYLFSPIQLIPSYIPVIGFLDDFLVLFLGAKLLRRLISPEILTECRELAKAAEMRRKDEIRSPAAVVAAIAIAAVWLLAAIAASRLIGYFVIE